jgi:hypothetical protein
MKPSLPGLALLFRASILLTLFLTGCGALNRENSGVATQAIRRGSVHGGQQPVSGATIQLYAVGTTGDGSAATPLLTPAATSDANGNFNITGTYTCPAPASLIYIVATGGNPGLSAGTNNAALSLMAALGPCNTLSSSTFIQINEVTTVGAVYPLAPFMTSFSAVGSSTSDAQSLTDAFTMASQLVNFNTGTSPGTFVPSGYAVPASEINTIANILATCINSIGGVAGDGTSCGNLFSLTTPVTTPATTPATDTITALLHLANNPTLNTTALFNMAPPTSPFQPQLAQAPSYFSVALMPASGTPTFTISPASINFPATTIGFSSPWQSITLTNNSQSSVRISDNGVFGANGFDFALFYGDCAIVAPGASCTLQADFTPTAAGSRSALFSLTSTAPDSPQTISFSGTGLALSSNQLTYSASSLAFTKFGIPATITLTNNGSGPINIGGINVFDSLSYLDPQWSQTNNCGSSLPGQSICTITIVSNDLIGSPTGQLSQGVTQGSLTIVNDSSTGTHSIPLSTSSYFTVSGAPIDFGNVAVGTSQQRSFRSDTFNRIYSPAFNMSLSGTNASDFSFPQGGACSPPGYPANVSCTLPIAFTPSAPGLRTATLTTTYGNVALTGGGNGVTGASFYAVPASLFLPHSSQSGTVTIYNVGSTTLSLTPTLTGPNATLFTDINTCESVAPGASCSIPVSPTSTQAGQASATLTVTDGASGIQQSIPVFLAPGQFTPAPYTDPATLNFPDTPVNQTSIPIILAVYTPNNDPFTISGGNVSSNRVSCTQAGAQCLSIQVTPSTVGPNNGSVDIHDTVTQSLFTVNFTVNGIIVGSPAVSLSLSSIIFPTRPVGSTSIPQTITVTNSGSGNAPLSLSSISLSGANPGDYVLTNGCGSSLSVSAHCTLSVSFSPTVSGTRTATIQIVSNASTSPDLIQLTGTAQ